ncbi:MULTISPECIES: hypothetical protein [unclassified Corynebacterium]|uniref:hypothetical protein n=1 Tax=unclassified Corynebacterium TaxID=2624378 RepID=UPI0029CA5CC3|nr:MULTISPECIES: hypothetical protein [unclassified Corynebacterium]WPF66980.1 hypothetical protein OLX12_04450 [Corynebacterium sp. 22KM0430]WPF69468.1 hypothetical protein OLW90_04445 [Corynebacterium sp. 21KM1197]
MSNLPTEEPRNPAARALVKGLDRAVRIQASTIESYVERLRAKNPQATPAEIQEKLDKHFLRLVSGSGASAGGASAIPGVGLLTGAAALSAESLVFLDTAAFYAVASAHAQGVDIHDPERRRMIVMMCLLGASGTAVVDALLPAGADRLSVPSVSRLSGSALGQINNRLLRTVLKRTTKKMAGAWVGKLMPLGIGAVVGLMANRKIAKRMIQHTREALAELKA